MNNKLLPIAVIADKLQIPQEYVEALGSYGAKLKLNLLQDANLPRRGKLILVTATTPTVSGEGKTITAIGLVAGIGANREEGDYHVQRTLTRSHLWHEGWCSGRGTFCVGAMRKD